MTGRSALPRTLKSLAVLILTASAFLFGPLAQSASAATTKATYEKKVIVYTNADRSDRKLHKLKSSSCLDEFAEAQAKAMAEAQTLYHQDLGAILKKCHLRQVGENVAFGYDSGKTVTQAWMDSPGHRANLLNSKHRLIGVGAYQDADGYWYVSQVLGKKL